MHRVALTLTALSLALTVASQPAYGRESQKERNALALRGYLKPYTPTKLEWDITQFNLVWAGAYLRSEGDYLTSYPIVFDYRTMRFRTVIRISETREYKDPDPWSSLSRMKRESILQGAIDHLKKMLVPGFPEVQSRPELLYVEFSYTPRGGGAPVNAAIYENGKLSLADQ